MVYILISYANISHHNYDDTVSDLNVIRNQLIHYNTEQLKDMVNTYNTITKHSVTIKVMNIGFNCNCGLTTYTKLKSFFDKNNYLRFYQYYPKADRTVMFSFHPLKTQTDLIVIGLITSQILLIILVLYLLGRYLLGSLSSALISIEPKKNGFKLFAKQRSKLIMRINELTAERVFLVSTLFHDLKSPLTRMQLKLDYRLDQNTPYIKSIKEDLNEIINILNATKSYYKNEMEINTFAINEMIQDIEKTAPEKIKVEYQKEKIYIRAERYLLFRALINICHNALKYAGGCQINYYSISNNKICIEISDQGPGVPENELNNLFTPHVKNLHSDNCLETGHGLGLAITYKIIQLHNGGIQVQNTNPGLKFTIILDSSHMENK
ncbi:HAMP domain-containing histidine kinase [Thiotrichales bacterium 19S3-7]|nr:HAMP domain-containing histidine kinase [Thiotrichales bacterium 19S3-7]MCF6802627.1 HAMP domain-containing histidine kinase [Thiotrichales bacterium 19S3-11]